MCVRAREQTHSSWNELARTHSDSLSVLRGVGISDYALKEKCETLHACFESVMTLSSENTNMHHRNLLVQLLEYLLCFLKKEWVLLIRLELSKNIDFLIKLSLKIYKATSLL